MPVQASIFYQAPTLTYNDYFVVYILFTVDIVYTVYKIIPYIIVLQKLEEPDSPINLEHSSTQKKCGVKRRRRRNWSKKRVSRVCILLIQCILFYGADWN